VSKNIYAGLGPIRRRLAPLVPSILAGLVLSDPAEGVYGAGLHVSAADLLGVNSRLYQPFHRIFPANKATAKLERTQTAKLAKS